MCSAFASHVNIINLVAREILKGLIMNITFCRVTICIQIILGSMFYKNYQIQIELRNLFDTKKSIQNFSIKIFDKKVGKLMCTNYSMLLMKLSLGTI